MTDQTIAHQNGASRPYNPNDHLIKIKTKDGLKDYYPAAWRLYELTLRYEDANFSSDILLMDVEHNLVVVKCRLYLGSDYEMSRKKTEALKSGSLSQLDKVETAAKARCARDFGCGTEYALESEGDDIVVEEHKDDDLSGEKARIQASLAPVHPSAQTAKAESSEHTSSHRLEAIQELFASTYTVQPDALAAKWAAFKVHVLGIPVDDSKLTEAQLARLHDSMTAKQREHVPQQRPNGYQYQPACTPEAVQAFYAKTYQIKAVELEAKWSKFVQGVAGRALSKGPLSEDELNKLNGVISQAWQRKHSGRSRPAA